MFYLPEKYTISGVLRLPLANVTEAFEASMDLKQELAIVKYLDGPASTVWNTKTWHTFMQADHINCTHTVNGHNGTEKIPITTMLPKFSEDWKQLPETVLRGYTVNHFRLYTIQSLKPEEDPNFVYSMEDFQDYYCIPGAEGYCIPWRWEIHGYNTNGGSHADLYQIDYFEFSSQPIFGPDTFTTPKECDYINTAESKPVGWDLFFLSLKNEVVLDQNDALDRINNDYSMSFTVGPNKFSNVEPEEFRRLYTGYVPKPAKNNQHYYQLQSLDVPKELDLRLRGVVTPVKDQAACGSCWTFSTAGVLEGRINYINRKKGKPLLRVSEQQILSCTWLDDVKDKVKRENLGCNGGETNLALDMIIERLKGKIPLESESPYLGMESKCEIDNPKVWTTNYGIVNKTIMIDEKESTEKRTQMLKEALLSGPVGVSIAVPESMIFYRGGVFNDKACGYGNDAQLTHAVLAIGWGTDEEYGDYWIIKNSWSNAWGMDGYIYIAMDNDLCGVTTKATWFEIDKAGAPANETFYHFKGTFSLPYANVTQEMEVWYDEAGQREKISYFNDTDFSIWNLKNESEENRFFGVVTYLPEGKKESKQYCTMTPTIGLNRSALTPIFPDLSANWTQLDDTMVMGQMLKHYRLVTKDIGADEPPVFAASYGFVREDQQDYYCKDEGMHCTPVRWELHGYNTIFGSHYDYYVLEVNQFERPDTMPAEVFEKPHTPEGKPMDCKEFKPATGGRWSEAISAMGQPHNDVASQNMQMIAKHNADTTQTYVMAPNKFVGLDLESFLHRHTGFNKRPDTATDYKHQVPFVAPELDPKGRWYMDKSGVKVQFPKHLDWRIKGGVPPVRDQANCGSCWAFGTASVIEARINKMNIDDHYSPLFLMSEQAIVDCIWSRGRANKNEGLHGCDGGFADETMERIIDNFGGKLPYLSDYPYMSQNMKCNLTAWEKGYSKLTLKSFSKTKVNSTGELKYALLDGPVTVAIAVTGKMVFYAGGIYDDPDCPNDPNKLSHQVVATGWGVDEITGKEYWIIRNSWSNAWGIDGYIYIAIDNLICGVTQEATIPNFK